MTEKERLIKRGSVTVQRKGGDNGRESANMLEAVIEAMKKAHPYEVPAYGVVELIDILRT
ncbi:MAG TPA: hypothetical protein EYG67_04655 [Campylobacterales bacterium]|nr:hypothetical protein [Campylobacterales bacterium]HIP42071.1 hypothetical protein [Campylobacterales bacterium]